MQKLVVLFFAFLAVSLETQGQSSKDVGPPVPPQARYQTSKPKSGFIANLKKNKKTDQEIFRERVKEVQKQRAKEEKLSKKPEYSNPLYFGHKKPPKKRELKKRKLCKTCHIVH